MLHQTVEPGKLTIVMGPMFAGKTTELQRRVKREIYARRRVCIIKYQKDTRYSQSCVSTHDKYLLKATYACDRLSDVPHAEWSQYDMIAIDEGQFFPDLVTFCSAAADAGKTVLVVALDGDFLRRPFGQVCQLIPMAEEVHKITAVCMSCHMRDASFTRRTVMSDATELIGGADMYVAVCRKCYNQQQPPTPARVNEYVLSTKTTCDQVMQARAVSASVPAVEPTPVKAVVTCVAHTPSLAPASPLQVRAPNAGAVAAASPMVKPTVLSPPALLSLAGARRERDEPALAVDLPMPLE